VLTLAHFMKGSSYTKFPEPDITHLREGRLSSGWPRCSNICGKGGAASICPYFKRGASRNV